MTGLNSLPSASASLARQAAMSSSLFALSASPLSIRAICFFRSFILALRAAVLLADVVEKLFYAEHVAVVGDGNALHAVLHGLVYQPADAGLAVEERILRVDV